VDDHVDTREMYAILLRDRGYLVYEAADGPSALTTVRSIQLDAAIVDISLPGMDGYELARQVRADVSQSRVALIAVTGHGLPEHLALSRLVGFDAHLVKPVSPNDLFKALDTLAPGAD
jgi:CheY-like chemotaxis protein